MTEQSNDAGDADAGAEQTAAERPAARHGPPIEVAVEVLDERGEETAAILNGVLGSYALESGGRDDIPWATVDTADLHEAARLCRDAPELHMDMLHCEFAVDYVERIQMLYLLYSVPHNRRAMLKVDLPAEGPVVDSVTDLWIAAEWYEREAHDLFGVDFTGNEDLSPLLLYEGFEGHPGLKSYPLNDYQEW